MKVSKKSRPRVVAVVLNWNNYLDSRRCIKSLLNLEYPNLDICIVDNNSSDDSGEKLKRDFPTVTILVNESNKGFTGGMNKGIKHALDKGAEYIWLLNNDVVVSDPDVLGRLTDKMNQDQSVGAITPKVTEYPNIDENWFIQGLVDWSSGNSNHLDHIADQSRWEGDIVYNDFIPFCSSLIRGRIFTEVGLLSEKYFLYHEDVDFCKRMLDSGYLIATDTSTEVSHGGSNTTGGKLSKVMTYYTTRNRWILSREVDDIDARSFYFHYIFWSLETIVFSIYSLEMNAIVAWFYGTKDGVLKVTGKGPYP